MKLLLLAGTTEARELAGLLADLSGLKVVASLAGAVKNPRILPVETRIGGFGSAAAQQAYLTDAGIGAVVDATHPFAQKISLRSQKICAGLGLPYLQILRPAWVPGPRDRWTMIDNGRQARAHIRTGSTVFLATGRQTLMDFKGLFGCRVICRVADPPEQGFPFPNGEYLVARPPYSLEAELSLFRKRRIDVLVAKNAGGVAGHSKLAAARSLNLPVLMIRRPPQPPGDKVTSAGMAAEWVRARL